MGKSKKKGANPYAEMGLEKFSLVKSELTAKREEISAKLGIPLSEIRLTSNAPGTWTAVYPSSALNSSNSSSSSSSPKSGGSSPRRTAFSNPPATAITVATAQKIKHEDTSERAIPSSDTATDMRAKLGFSLSLTGLTGLLCGVLYAAGSTQILLPILVFFASWYALHSNKKAVTRQIRQILGLIYPFLRPIINRNDSIAEKHDVSEKFDQNSSSAMQPASALSSSSQGNKYVANSATGSSKLSDKDHVTPQSKVLPSPAISESKNLNHKPTPLPSKMMHAKITQDEAGQKVESSGSRHKPHATVAASEKEKSMAVSNKPRRGVRNSRTVEKPDRIYSLLVMLIIAMTGLAFGMAPGIMWTSISWFFLPIIKEFAMSKDRESINEDAVKRRENVSSKPGTLDHRINHMQRR